MSTDSVFSGTSSSCYGANGLAATNPLSSRWMQAELKPSSSINNIYSIQLHFKSSGATPVDFAINDITIIYRQKPLK